jgi:copper chaperone CopZ
MNTTIIVQNLKCGGCAHTISTKLSELEFISDLDINVEKSEISFGYPKESDLIVIKEKLKNLGYPSIDDINSLGTKAKSFVSCATGKFSK